MVLIKERIQRDGYVLIWTHCATDEYAYLDTAGKVDPDFINLTRQPPSGAPVDLGLQWMKTLPRAED